MPKLGTVASWTASRSIWLCMDVSLGQRLPVFGNLVILIPE